MNNFFLICDLCGHPIPVSNNSVDKVTCERCNNKIHRKKSNSSLSLTLAYTLTALFFYFPANFFPFMTMELYGSRNSSTIWSGILSLIDSGAWAVAIVVLLTSIIIPLLKIAALLYLVIMAPQPKYAYAKTQLYRAVEILGRWSMLDIFLLAVLVAIMKLGPWTSVQPELGSLLFTLVVIFTMLASASFDSKLLWRHENV